MARLTVKELQALKGVRQLTCTTAHDYYTAKACNDAGIDMVVTSGEFIRQYIAGDFDRTNETLTDLLTALEGVRKGAPDVFIYASIPHSLATVSDSSAISAAMAAVCNGADAIYYSGISFSRIRAMADEKIPVVGHAGMIPWHKTWLGGCHAVGKTAQEALEVYEHAKKMEEAGCIAIEMECVPAPVAAEISKRLTIPVLSMGSGFGCDGQYIFSHDMLGQHANHYPRHTLRYAHQYEDACTAMKQFVADVASGRMEEVQKLVSIPPVELKKFMEGLK